MTERGVHGSVRREANEGAGPTVRRASIAWCRRCAHDDPAVRLQSQADRELETGGEEHLAAVAERGVEGAVGPIPDQGHAVSAPATSREREPEHQDPAL